MDGLSETHAHALLERRKISNRTAAKLGIVSRGADIGFPYRRRGALLFTKYRASPKKFWIEPQGAKLSLWNVDCCRDLSSTGGTLIITEGEFDAASCVEVGYPCVVSVPNGGTDKVSDGDVVPSDDVRFSYLWNDEKTGLTPDLAAAEKIILATDGDPVGRALASELVLRLGADRCWVVQWPEGTKDPNDVLVKYGAEALRSVIDSAVPLVPNTLVRYSEIPDVPVKEGLKTGWRQLDPHLKLTFPELIIVTGKPNSGKSRWALALVCQLARFHGIRSTYVSLEDSSGRMKRHSLAYAKAFAGKEIVTEYGEIVECIPAGGEIAWLDEHLFFVAPSEGEEDTRDLEWLKRTIWEAACRHGCRVVVLDPWNELEHLWDKRGGTVDEYINAALRELKRLMRRYGIILIIVAHPDKAAGRNESIEDMTLYSISGGAAWKNKADGGIIVGRDAGADTLIKVDKRKDWDTMGMPGTARLFIDEDGLYKSR